MFAKIIVIISIAVLALAACAGAGVPQTEPAAQTPAGGPTQELPVTGETEAPAETAEAAPTEETASGEPERLVLSPEDWTPAASDETLQRGEVQIESAEVLTLESYPPQFQLRILGAKGDPCRLVRAVAAEPDAEGRIQVEVYTLFDPAALCAQVIDEFELNLPLGTLPAGEYTVLVNGQQVGEITAP